MVIGTRQSINVSGVIFFSTNGAPAGATAISGTYIYNKTLAGATVGYASAAAILLLLIAFAISAVQIVLFRRDKST